MEDNSLLDIINAGPEMSREGEFLWNGQQLQAHNEVRKRGIGFQVEEIKIRERMRLPQRTVCSPVSTFCSTRTFFLSSKKMARFEDGR